MIYPQQNSPRSTRGFILVLTLLGCASAWSSEFVLDDSGDTVVGEIRHTRSRYEDTIPYIARRFGLGYQEIKLVNPDLDTWIPGEDKEIVLPLHFVLPQAEKTGLVLNVPEMRLYYFPPAAPGEPRKVITYPLGVGREGWHTPYTKTQITAKTKNPSWTPPESIRQEHAEKGDFLPRVVGPGPDNPLGVYAMHMGLPSYLIHGTNKPYGVGMRVSHGCIRLYPEDIEALFTSVRIGTRVNIVNQPYKIGVKGDEIFLEAHPFLEEDRDEYSGSLTSVVRMLVNITQDNSYEIDWKLAQQVVDELRGIPVTIGRLKEANDLSKDIDPRVVDRMELQMETTLPDTEVLK